MKKVIIVISCLYLATISAMQPTSAGKAEDGCCVVKETIWVTQQVCSFLDNQIKHELSSSVWDINFRKEDHVVFCALANAKREFLWQEHQEVPLFPAFLPVPLVRNKKVGDTLTFTTKDNKVVLVVRCTGYEKSGLLIDQE